MCYLKGSEGQEMLRMEKLFLEPEENNSLIVDFLKDEDGFTAK